MNIDKLDYLINALQELKGSHLGNKEIFIEITGIDYKVIDFELHQGLCACPFSVKLIVEEKEESK